MKKKNGFTLIELLVVIALALSVVGLAVVSTIAISDKRKDDAYETVKEQVMTAAKQYFDSNAFLFEGLEDGSSGIITVGTLVNKDYLNKVTNPKTGKPLDKCDQVHVTKTDGIYKTKYIEYATIEGTKSCDSNDSIVITEPGGPSITTSYVKSTGGVVSAASSGWFNISVLGDANLNIDVVASENGNGKIAGIKMCSGATECSDYGDFVTTTNEYIDDQTFANDTATKHACYKAENSAGKSAFKCESPKVDRVAPTITVPQESSSWTRGTDINGTRKVVYNISVSDATSGVDKYRRFYNTSKLTETQANSSTYKWDAQNERYGETGGASNYAAYKTPTISFEFSSDGVRKLNHKVCDKAGNCGFAEYTVKFDKTPPVLTFNIKSSHKKNSSDWYSDSTLTFDYSIDDKFSGVGTYTRYWNLGGAPSENSTWVNETSGYKDTDTTYRMVKNGDGDSFVSPTASISSSGKPRRMRVIAYDEAGNSTQKEVAVYLDNVAPKCGTADGASTTWTNQSRTIKQKCSALSSCATIEKTYNGNNTAKKTDTVTITSKSGKTASCTYNVYYDKKAPVILGEGAGDVKCMNSSNQDHYKGYSIKFQDSDSGFSSYAYTYCCSCSSNSEMTGSNSATNTARGGQGPTGQIIETDFTRCTDGTGRLQYTVYDTAGNSTTSSVLTKGTWSEPHTNWTNGCHTSRWWNES